VPDFFDFYEFFDLMFRAGVSN